MSDLDLLTSEQLYRRDVAMACPPSLDVIPDGIEDLARAGSREARETLLLSLQSYIHYWATRYAYAYAWAHPRIEYSELVSAANLAIVEKMERASTKESMCAYLASVARGTMQHYCWCYQSLIVTPSGREKYPHYRTDSMDKPMRDDPTLTLAGTLAAPDVLLTNSDPDEREKEVQERRMEAVKQAFPALPERYQQVLTRLYGLDGREPESQRQVAKDIADRPVAQESVFQMRDQACAALCKLLGLLPTEKYEHKHRQRLARAKKQRQAIANDPVRLEKKHASQRAYRAKKRAEGELDPVVREAQRQQQRAYSATYRANKRAQLAQKAECA